MEFAERQLRKQGWSKGKGLGRHQDGISEALKVKIKCDKTGVGHRAGEQFTFHWWDHIFNTAAANVTVEAEEDGAEVREVREDGGGLPISNEKPRKAQLCKELLYGRFVKAATLMPGNEAVWATPDSSDDSEADDKLDLSSTTRLTDEELLWVCGGRTGHKGARHGVTMSAKLLRLEEQERQFLAKYKPGCQSGVAEGECPHGEVTEGGATQKKKKRKRERAASRQEADGSKTEGGRQQDGESQHAGTEPESGVPVTSGQDLAPELGPRRSEGKRKRRKREVAAQSEECGHTRKRGKGECCPLG